MSHEPPSPGGPAGPELLGWLLEKHAAALTLYARQFCGSPDDVVQEALVELVEQPSVPVQLMPWLYRVVRNKAISASRAASRRQRHEGHAAQGRPSWFVRQEGDRLDGQTVREVLGTLPPDQREIVVAYLWGGLTFAEIGRLMGISDSSAHRRYLEALAQIRNRLSQPCPKTN